MAVPPRRRLLSWRASLTGANNGQRRRCETGTPSSTRLASRRWCTTRRSCQRGLGGAGHDVFFDTLVGHAARAARGGPRLWMKDLVNHGSPSSSYTGRQPRTRAVSMALAERRAMWKKGVRPLRDWAREPPSAEERRAHPLHPQQRTRTSDRTTLHIVSYIHAWVQPL